VQIESLAFGTDLALLQLGGSEVEDHESYVAVRSREDLAALAKAGLSVGASTVMTAPATSVREPPRPNRDAAYRRLATDADWQQQVELAVASAGRSYEQDFVVAKAAAQRRTAESESGTWWGAFVGDRLVCSMGLFRASPGYAGSRTSRRTRRPRPRSAGTLVHEISRCGIQELGATTLVMVADPDYVAVRIYRSVGFEDSETHLQAEREAHDACAER
jgi:hypothetical protein